MRSFIVGTAGHIDHGKSSLVEALTGTDPDRLKEEKERGITIDLGFAHAALEDDVEASFVDVPGHERFIHNMLAGAHGIDAVMLVIAANEGVMPQTREHFLICSLLGIKRGVIVLSKNDAAEPGLADLAEQDARSLTRGSFLEAAAIVRVSARTGEGLQDLRRALLDLARQSAARPTDGLLRLPIDRAFTMKGFGTVVTGTLIAGEIALGDEIVLMPAETPARVRGVQVHGRSVTRAGAGDRCALNLAGIEVGEIARGDIVAKKHTLRPTRLLDVSLRLLPGAPPLKHGSRVRVHAGSAELLGRVRLAGPLLAPGAVTEAQLRLERETVAGRDDALVLRSYSPQDTIGGCRVLDPAPRHRARSEISALESLRSKSPADAAVFLVTDAGAKGLDEEAIAARLTLPVPRIAPLLAAIRDPPLVRVEAPLPLWLRADALAQLENTLLSGVRESHQKDPLSPGLSREKARRLLPRSCPAAVFEHVVRALTQRGDITELGDLLSARAHRVRLSPPEEDARSAIEAALAASGVAGIGLRDLHVAVRKDRVVCERVVRVLIQENAAHRVGDGLLVGRVFLDALRARMMEKYAAGEPIDVGAIKDMLGLTRKHVIPLLEWLDAQNVTRRVGEGRVRL